MARRLNADELDGRPTAADISALKREAAARNGGAGRQLTAEEFEAMSEGSRQEAGPDARVGLSQSDQGAAFSSGALAQRSGRGFRAVATGGTSDGAGFLLGLIVYAVFLNYVRAGPAGATAWIKAKFLNQTTGAPAAAKLTPAAPDFAADSAAGRAVAGLRSDTAAIVGGPR
ncbi:MAG: hypothetical protein ACR2MO_08575 [Acidimicrobiales bacterium]